MNPLPPIVKHRLGSGPSDVHPDAGVLTAFMEHSLRGSRREAVLNHLAACSRCNAVVALALPEPIEAVRPTAPERTWMRLRFPRWQWAAAGSMAAAALTLGTFLITRPLPLPAPVAYRAVPAQVSPVTSTPQQQQMAGLSSPAARAVSKPGPSAPRPAPSQAEVATAMPHTFQGLGPDAAQVSMNSGELPNPAALPLRLPPPDAQPSAASTQPNPSASAPKPTVPVPAAGPCWRVSGEGELQKSLDCTTAWTAIALPVPVHARAFQMLGASLWLGGNAGALYHSSDNGATWNQVAVTGISGDIVAIAFASATRGALSTSTGESWFTTDGGLTWTRR